MRLPILSPRRISSLTISLRLTASSTASWMLPAKPLASDFALPIFAVMFHVSGDAMVAIDTHPMFAEFHYERPVKLSLRCNAFNQLRNVSCVPGRSSCGSLVAETVQGV